MGLRDKYSSSNPAYALKVDGRFVFSHPAHAIALFFGAGAMRPGPGTWGSLAGVCVWALLVQFLDWRALTALILVTFVVGVWASQKTSDDLGVEDAGCIVIDEVVAVWMVCLVFPQNIVCWTAAFLAFRLFDIVKLPPAGLIDEKMHSGFGIMLDDVLAAVWAIAALLLLDWTLAKVFEKSMTFLGVFS